MGSYEEIMAELKKNFPSGTVEFSSNKMAYIPVQAYMNRLEEVAASNWEWRIVDAPVINKEDGIVLVKGEITLVQTVRQGIGVANISKNLKNAIMTAESEAFRDACDKFQMGWRDLAPHRDWANNPGVGLNSKPNNKIENFNEAVHSVLDPVSSERKCMKCSRALTNQDELFLSINNVKFPYCHEHVPKQFIKKV